MFTKAVSGDATKGGKFSFGAAGSRREVPTDLSCAVGADCVVFDLGAGDRGVGAMAGGVGGRAGRALKHPSVKVARAR